MDTWIKADVDFGSPVINFTLDFRSIYGRDLSKSYNAIDPEKLEEELKTLIIKFRPELKDGLSILAVSASIGRFRWEVCCTHHSFQRVVIGESPPSIQLERCIVCGKDIPSNAQIFRCARRIGFTGALHEYEVCSQECANKGLPALL